MACVFPPIDLGFYLISEKQLKKIQMNMIKEIIIEYFSELSPFVEVHMGTRLVNDLGLDSLDIASAMTDIARMTDTSLSTHKLLSEYGPDPTIANVITFVSQRYVPSMS